MMVMTKKGMQKECDREAGIKAQKREEYILLIKDDETSI